MKTTLPMNATQSRAAVAAGAPEEAAGPRIIQQAASVFLVSRCGELWRVYDTTNPGAAFRSMPSPSSALPHRVFLALAPTSELRIHTFDGCAPRATDPASLQQQLDDSRAA